MNPGEYADVLRAVGRFLDEQSAEGVLDVHISDMGTHLALKWSTGDLTEAEAAYKELDLQLLREQGIAMRQAQAGGAAPRETGPTRAEFLRTLGQDLDVQQINFSTIQELDDGFLVSGTQHGGYFRENFLFSTLYEESQARREARHAPGASVRASRNTPAPTPSASAAPPLSAPTPAPVAARTGGPRSVPAPAAQADADRGIAALRRRRTAPPIVPILIGVGGLLVVFVVLAVVLMGRSGEEPAVPTPAPEPTVEEVEEEESFLQRPGYWSSGAVDLTVTLRAGRTMDHG
jgi:hypothetical protein